MERLHIMLKLIHFNFLIWIGWGFWNFWSLGVLHDVILLILFPYTGYWCNNNYRGYQYSYCNATNSSPNDNGNIIKGSSSSCITCGLTTTCMFTTTCRLSTITCRKINISLIDTQFMIIFLLVLQNGPLKPYAQKQM